MAANEGSGMDEKAHVATYTGFLNMAKWGTIATIIIVAIVVLLIAS
ncbi:aa3-type cytochrome c oxidase subunit IV [Sphingomonas montana]|nr:aa3-type cytochrome c oxidase subunit IV [Sphingomonas montana]